MTIEAKTTQRAQFPSKPADSIEIATDSQRAPLGVTLRLHNAGLDLCFSEPNKAPVTTTTSWAGLHEEIKEGITEIWNSHDIEDPDPDMLKNLGAVMYRFVLNGVIAARNAKVGPAIALDVDLEIETHQLTPSPANAALDDDELEALRELEAIADEAIEAGDNRRALDIVQNVMTHYRKRGDTLGVARCTIRGAELLMEGERFHETAHNWLIRALVDYQYHKPDGHDRQSSRWRGRAGLGLTRLYRYDGRYADALARCGDAIDDAEDAPGSIRGPLFLERARIFEHLSKTDESRSSYHQAIQVLRSSPDLSQLLGQAHRELGQSLMEADDLGAHVHFEAALRIAREDNDIDQVIKLSALLSWLSEEQGDLQLAWGYASRALPYADNQPEPTSSRTLLSRLLHIGRSGAIKREILDPIIERTRKALTRTDDWRAISELMAPLLPIILQLQAIDLAEPLINQMARLTALLPTDLPSTGPHKAGHYRTTVTRLADNAFMIAGWLERREQFDLARQAFRHVIAFSDRTQTVTRAIEAQCGMGRCETALGLLSNAEKTFDDALERSSRQEINSTNLHMGRAQLHRVSGNLIHARDDLQEVLAFHRESEITSQVVHTLIQIADLDIDRAELDFVEKTLKTPEKAFNLAARGEILLASEELRSCLAEANRCLTEASQDGILARENPLYLTCVGRLHMLHGDSEAAILSFESTLQIAHDAKPIVVIRSVCGLAEALAHQHGIKDAYQTINKARQMISSIGGPIEQILYLRSAGRVMYLLGDPGRAIPLLAKAVAAARVFHNPYLDQIMRLESNLLVALQGSGV